MNKIQPLALFCCFFFFFSFSLCVYYICNWITLHLKLIQMCVYVYIYIFFLRFFLLSVIRLLQDVENSSLRYTVNPYYLFIFLFFFNFYFIFKVYNIVLVLPNIEMNLPQVYPHSPSWTLLPPPSPTVPLGRPSAPVPNIQYRASNLDWHLVSYMIFYMFQCHSPKSSHPLPLPQSP